jgi:hypothetical protein
MDVQEEAGFLLASYASGSIALWDLVDYKLLKSISNVHETLITNAKIYFVGNNGNQI